MTSASALLVLLQLLRREAAEGPQNTVDWEHVARLAWEMGVAPLLYRGLKNGSNGVVPAGAMTLLEMVYYKSLADNVLHFDQLELVLAALRLADVPAIVLKGGALAKTVYPDIGCRPMKDLDILVRQDQLRQASTALQTLDYTFDLDPEGHTQHFREGFDGELRFLRSKENSCSIVDLHWHVVSGYPWLRELWPLDMEQVWLRARPISLGKGPPLQLSPEDTLLHLCLHTAAHHKYASFLPYCDIDRVISTYNVDWDRLANEATQARARVPVFFALFFTSRLLGTKVPVGVLDELRPQAWRRRLITRLADPLSNTGASSVGDKGQVAFHLLLADGPRSLTRVALGALLPNRSWLASRYNEKGIGLSWRRAAHLVKTIGYGLSSLGEFLPRVFRKR